MIIIYKENHRNASCALGFRSMHSSQFGLMQSSAASKAAPAKADDDDWDTDPDYVNDVSETEARRQNPNDKVSVRACILTYCTITAMQMNVSDKEIVDLKEAKKGVISAHEDKTKKEYAGSSFSRGYGGAFGKEST